MAQFEQVIASQTDATLSFQTLSLLRRDTQQPNSLSSTMAGASARMAHRVILREHLRGGQAGIGLAIQLDHVREIESRRYFTTMKKIAQCDFYSCVR